jgi:hypothetical protein
MNVDELFNHALVTLPEAVTDVLRDGRDPSQLVFASFEGASDLGVSLIAADFATDHGASVPEARAEVERLLLAAGYRGEELVVSLMVTKDVLARILSVSQIDAPTRIALRLWMDVPLPNGHIRVLAVGRSDMRAGVVDSASDDAEESPPVSRSMLN